MDDNGSINTSQRNNSEAGSLLSAATSAANSFAELVGSIELTLKEENEALAAENRQIQVRLFLREAQIRRGLAAAVGRWLMRGAGECSVWRFAGARKYKFN